MSWGLLLRLAGAKTAVLMVVVGIALRDKEALAIGLGLAVGVGLLHLREGGLGRAALFLLGLDVVGWMATAAVTNVAHGEDALAVLVPLALSLAGGVTVVAAACDVLRRHGRPNGGRRGAVAVAAGSFVLIVAGLVLSQLDLFGSPARAAAGDVVLPMKDARFGSKRIDVRAGQVAVVVDNHDLFWHTFTIDALHVDTRVPVKGRRRVAFTVQQPGIYTFYCAIPGHRSIGMEGKLVVSPSD